jgi:L-asparaginase/Glu-tRNA(Gln) amidotransferase subunit D
MSRGAGQWQQAGIDAAQKMAQGVADAYSQDTQTAGYNAQNSLAGQQAQEQYAQQVGALQQQDSYAQAMAALQRKQQSLNFASSLLGGLLR